MMSRSLWRLKQKWISCQGETLPELLISVLIIVLGLTMFATALMAARRMLAEGDTILQGYYQERNVLEQENGKTLDGTLTLGNVSDVSDPRMNLTLPYQSGKDTSDKGTYSISVYTEQKSTADESSSQPKYYRYCIK